jgi:lysophospholipase L1-like esterase
VAARAGAESTSSEVTPSTWSEIPAVPRATPRSRGWRVLTRLLLPLAFAGILWLLDFEVAAVLVAIAVVVLTVIGIASPALSQRIEHVMARFGHWVGSVIGFVLLTIVNLFVFTPIAFFMWLFRHDTLAPGVRRDAPSFWHAHTGRAFPKRQFTDERALWAPVGATRAPRRPILRVATVVGVVSLILVADLGAGWVYDEVSNETHGTAAVADDTFDPPNEPALRDSPWAAEVLAEQEELPGKVDPFLGYRMGSKASTYTNVVDGVRTSYQSKAPGQKISVWFFGASALFGSGQRDDHTIPSEFARLAEADGLPVEVRNYGRPAVSMWQELELFQQLVSSGQRPDLVVFYDGFNDLAWQMNIELSTEPTNIYAVRDTTTNVGAGGVDSATRITTPTSTDGGTTLDDVVDAYWDQSASHHVYDALHDLIAGDDEKQKVQFAKGVEQKDPATTPSTEHDAAQNAISIQSRAATLAAAVAESVGAQASFFWQPTVFTKRLLPDEERYLSLDTYEPARWDPAVKEARSLLKSTPFVDVGDALDLATSPVFWDFVHTNEEGARLSAVALYSNLHAQLEARAEAASK